MSTKLYNQNHRRNQGLIAANKIKPEIWRLSPVDIIKAINATGCKAKKIKKINYLKHQICISYWDEKGGVCSGFFSYRILERWQNAVQNLVYNCGSLYEMHYLSQFIEYEFAHYPYPYEMQAAIAETIEACTSQIVEASYKRNIDLVA